MTMKAMNNTSAAFALNELNKNNNKLSKDLKKVSSGMRITGAGDSAAEYAISEKMRVLTRALNQDIDNSKKGLNLVKVAEGGIQSIIDELRNMKAMALDSANGHNAEIDRTTIQKEFASRIEEISDIASTTEYNGIILLDGRWYRPSERTTTITEEILIHTKTAGGSGGADGASGSGGSSGAEGSGGSSGAEGSSGSSGAGGSGEAGGATPTTGGLVRPTSTTPIIIPSGDYTISTDGVYKLDANYKGTITITAKNVELQQTDLAVYDTYINCTSDHQNLWLNKITIRNAGGETGNFVEKSILKFNGTGNTLNLINNNSLYNLSSKTKAVVNVGEGLSINDPTGTGSLWADSAPTVPAMNNKFLSYAACIGSDEGEQSNGYIVINGGKINCGADNYGAPWRYNDGGYHAAAIGSGKNGSIGQISINGGDITAYSRFGAAIGSGYNGAVNGDIIIRGGTIDARSRCNRVTLGVGGNDVIEHSTGAAIGAGENGKVNGNIIIKGGNIAAKSQGFGAAIGCGSFEFNPTDSSVGNIIIKDCTLHAESFCGEAIGQSVIDHEEHNPIPPVYYPFGFGQTTMVNNKVGGVVGTKNIYGGSYSEPETVELKNFYHVYDRDVSDTAGASAPDSDPGDPPESIIPTDPPDDPGSGETGGGSGETTPPTPPTPPTEPTEPVDEVIRKLITKEIKEHIPGHPLIIHTGPKANQNLPIYINDMRPDAIGLTDVAVDPIEKALEAIDKLDAALEYALNENTHMGAYQVRLQEIIDNLESKLERMIASESVIRDADMAKEMASYIKNNILSQSSQAMLAQANKNSSSVLQLLQ